MTTTLRRRGAALAAIMIAVTGATTLALSPTALAGTCRAGGTYEVEAVPVNGSAASQATLSLTACQASFVSAESGTVTLSNGFTGSYARFLSGGQRRLSVTFDGTAIRWESGDGSAGYTFYGEGFENGVKTADLTLRRTS